MNETPTPIDGHAAFTAEVKSVASSIVLGAIAELLADREITKDDNAEKDDDYYYSRDEIAALMERVDDEALWNIVGPAADRICDLIGIPQF